MSEKYITIKGARQHNLKNINVTIPRDKLTVVTGVSGSGKSSLAFDTIYAEGQRRYVESLSAYARQFLGQIEKPEVDSIQGLSPAISIDQKGAGKNPRSTVGTVTEIYDYLRLLYARIGIPHCPKCGRVIAKQSEDQIVNDILEKMEGKKIIVEAPIAKGRKGEYLEVFNRLRKRGYIRVRVDGVIRELSENIVLDKTFKHDISVIVDRIQVRGTDRGRLAESVEQALELGEGVVEIDLPEEEGEEEERTLYSQNFACKHCNFSMEEPEPRNFSFNNPHGACPACTGLGVAMELNEESLVEDASLSIEEGVMTNWFKGGEQNWIKEQVVQMAKGLGVGTKVAWKDLRKEERETVLFGKSRRRQPLQRYRGFGGRTRIIHHELEGVIPFLSRRYEESQSATLREEIEKLMMQTPCRECGGKRLKKEYLVVTIKGMGIMEVAEMDIQEAGKWFQQLSLTEREQQIGEKVIKEIKERLGFLENVGLGYLTLERRAGSLSGGESQRIRLATQIGSRLMGVLYILDEPSIGLHQRDNRKLLDTLRELRDLGNTLIVVEHDEDTIRSADYVVDVGPGAGVGGGKVVVAGGIDKILKAKGSLTGQYLRGEKLIEVPRERRKGNGKELVIKGAGANNLKMIDVRLPLGTFVAVSGVSGSGKSTLINNILYRHLAKIFYQSKEQPGKFKKMEGVENIDKVINIDQAPIGRTPRSNPATYVGVFNDIRQLYSLLPQAKIRGYKPGRFSFNVVGGRCESCSGDGVNKIEMHFLPDIYVTCETCKGKRYTQEVLEVEFQGRNIADVLAMTVDEAVSLFQNQPAISRKLKTLQEVGLGYVQLGQPATQLSGGEAQRVKLGAELGKKATGRTLYILDEPTTGLHFADVAKLLGALQKLVDGGNTVVVIEHNLEVIKTADWVVDLGPEGGGGGGQIVAEGSPETIAACKNSATGEYLARLLA